MHRRKTKVRTIEVQPQETFCTKLSNISYAGSKMLKKDCITFFKIMTDSCFRWDKRAERQNRINAIQKEREKNKFKIN